MMFGPFFGFYVISGTKTLQFSVKIFFIFGLHLNSRTKTFKFLVKTFFFGLHLICLREKNRGRASLPPVENRAKLE